MEDEFGEREAKPKYESSNPNFPLSVELGKLRFKPDPPKEPTRGWRLVRGTLIGAGLGLARISHRRIVDLGELGRRK
jgi:hypothetical protein